jgi:hypothetical protein
MSITIKQLEELSNKYNFDVAEARAFLGHKKPEKRGRPAKKMDDPGKKRDDITLEGLTAFLSKSLGSSCNTSPVTTKKMNTQKTETKKSETKSTSGRRPSGYNLFVKQSGLPIAEAAKQWKDLSDNKRKAWNTKAANM